MKKRTLLKLLFVYSYISLFCYVGSESALNVVRGMNGETDQNGNKKKLKFESLWKDTISRFKECYRLINE